MPSALVQSSSVAVRGCQGGLKVPPLVLTPPSRRQLLFASAERNLPPLFVLRLRLQGKEVRYGPVVFSPT
eukprot:scaffold2714_cov413-Prasinococcus_capsulatus_cf.AAC.7